MKWLELENVLCFHIGYVVILIKSRNTLNIDDTSKGTT